MDLMDAITPTTPDDESPTSTPSVGGSAMSNKRQEQLKRVSLACEQCRSRKIKCNGKNPCDQCTSHRRSCHRAAGRKPRDRGLKDKQINHLESRIMELERHLSIHLGKKEEEVEIKEQAPPEQEQLLTPKSSASSSQSSITNLNASKSPQSTNFTLLRSGKGQYKYLGSASALTLAYQLQRATIEDVDREGSVFPSYNLDDNDFDCHKPFRHPTLPPRSISDQLVDAFFTTVNKQLPFFEESQFRQRLEDTFNREIYETPCWTACYLLVYALGAWQMEPTRSRDFRDLPGHDYFDSAIGLMDAMFKEATPESMMVSLLVVVYMMGVAKISVSYTILGVTSRTLQSIGAHRETTAADSNLRRRAFYICYVLEKSLTFTLGRPSAIQDFDCDVERPRARSGDPVDVFVENIELARITGLIHQRLYCARSLAELARSPVGESATRGNELITELEKWRANLPHAYRTLGPNMPSDAVTLHLNYYNLLISVHRSHADTAFCNEHCVVEPARRLILLLRDRNHTMDSGAWLELYQVFAAAAIVYKFRLKDVVKPSPADLELVQIVHDKARGCTGYVSIGEYICGIISRWSESLSNKSESFGKMEPEIESPEPRSVVPSNYGIDVAYGVQYPTPVEYPPQQPLAFTGLIGSNANTLDVPYEYGEFTVPAWLDMGQQMDWINWDINSGL